MEGVANFLELIKKVTFQYSDEKHSLHIICFSDTNADTVIRRFHTSTG